MKEDDSWEDIPASEIKREDEQTTMDVTPTSPSPASSLRSQPGSPRKRRQRVEYIASTSPRKTRSATKAKRTRSRSKEREREPAITRDEAIHGLLHLLVFFLRYAFSVFRTSIHMLRFPLAVVVALYLLGYISGQISRTVSKAFTPFCYLPFISSSPLCRAFFPPHDPDNNPQWADYPKLVDVQSTTFGQLLDETIGGSSLSLEIKKAEMATADLVTVVKYSELGAKDQLADALEDFVRDAKDTGRSLQKLSSRVGGSVDQIMAANQYALRTIESAQSSPSSSSLFSLLPFSTKKSPEAIVTTMFRESMDVMSASLARSILEAELSERKLNDLEESLSLIHGLLAREDSSLSSQRADLLGALWTKLGGNRRELKGFDKHLRLLRGLGAYRRAARAHVTAALTTLRAMSDDMDDLRERVAAPEVVGSRIPIEVHVMSIQNGLERLQESRVRAKRREDEAMERILNVGDE